MTDPITDMLNQIKNVQAVGKTEILVPLSKIKEFRILQLELRIEYRIQNQPSGVPVGPAEFNSNY